MIGKGMRRSQLITLIAVFATLSIVCDSIVGIPQLASGIWYGWIFLIVPIAGIVLGPYAGFISILIGVIAGHSIYLRGEAPMYEYLFTLGAPIGAMFSGFIFRGRWKGAFTYFTLLLGAYFLTPVSWEIPLWGLWDVYIAFIVLCIFALMSNRWDVGSGKLERSPYIYVFCALIGLEADILFRIFVFIPGQTYRLFYGFTPEILEIIWAAGALVTPIQVGIAILMTGIIGPVLIRILSLKGWFQNKNDF
ncbi:hypothetical protein KAI11_00860 [Candidatus Bathyarchaeota archaeon]|nr:hypothetical protein [Candidatus Bathyarchaeota archaeon]